MYLYIRKSYFRKIKKETFFIEVVYSFIETTFSQKIFIEEKLFANIFAILITIATKILFNILTLICIV